MHMKLKYGFMGALLGALLTTNPARIIGKNNIGTLAKGAHADVVIFDLAMAQPEFAIALWKAQPRLLLIGVDLTTGQALVLSGQPSRLLTMDDLLQVIEG